MVLIKVAAGTKYKPLANSHLSRTQPPREVPSGFGLATSEENRMSGSSLELQITQSGLLSLSLFPTLV